MAKGTRVEGMDRLQRNLAKLGNRAPRAIEKGLFETAQEISGAAQEMVPVDTGTLRATAYAVTSSLKELGSKAEPAERPRKTKQIIEAIIGFGGPAAPYALAVHENPRSGKTGGVTPGGSVRRFFAAVGQWKYLETPFKFWAPKAPGIITKHVKRMINGVARGR